MKKIIEKAYNLGREKTQQGKVADYIPELSKVDRDQVGLCMITKDKKMISAGAYDTYFTMQSMSKVIPLILTLEENSHDHVFNRVGVTPSAESFNSIKQLETMNEHKPLNPFINAGAILTLSMVSGQDYEHKFQKIISLAEVLMDRRGLEIDEAVYASEKATGDRNRALAYYMSSTKIYNGDVEKILDIYFRMCSLKVNCVDIANIASVLSNKGKSIYTGQQLISKASTRAVNAIMASCGLYNGSGEFAVQVGLASKSGVGGGIMSVVPETCGIGVFSPALDEHGNSIVGIEMLKYLSETMELSMY